MKKNRWFIFPVIMALLLTVSIFAGIVLISKNAVYTHVVDYNENALFPVKSEISRTWIRPIGIEAWMADGGNGTLQIFADSGLTKRLSESYVSDALTGTSPDKINIQTVKFSYASYMKQVYVSVPDYLVYAELSEPVIIDLTASVQAESGVITEYTVQLDGELAYTIRSCKTEPDSEGYQYLAVLIEPRAGQTYSLDGFVGDGLSNNADIIKAYPNNRIADRVESASGMIYRDTDLVRQCEELLGINADELDDNCTLLHDIIYSNETAVFRADVVHSRIKGEVIAVDPSTMQAITP